MNNTLTKSVTWLPMLKEYRILITSSEGGYPIYIGHRKTKNEADSLVLRKLNKELKKSI